LLLVVDIAPVAHGHHDNLAFSFTEDHAPVADSETRAGAALEATNVAMSR